MTAVIYHCGDVSGTQNIYVSRILRHSWYFRAASFQAECEGFLQDFPSAVLKPELWMLEGKIKGSVPYGAW